MRHGTLYGYVGKRCRCKRCRKAYSDSRRAWLAKHRAANTEVYQRQLAANRARKKRYRGTCERCGGTTNGSNGRAAAPKLCIDCARIVNGARDRERYLGRGPIIERALAFCITPRRYSELRDELEIDDNYASALTNRAVRQGLLERPERGVYVTAPGWRPS